MTETQDVQHAHQLLDNQKFDDQPGLNQDFSSSGTCVTFSTLS